MCACKRTIEQAHTCIVTCVAPLELPQACSGEQTIPSPRWVSLVGSVREHLAFRGGFLRVPLSQVRTSIRTKIPFPHPAPRSLPSFHSYVRYVAPLEVPYMRTRHAAVNRTSRPRTFLRVSLSQFRTSTRTKHPVPAPRSFPPPLAAAHWALRRARGLRCAGRPRTRWRRRPWRLRPQVLSGSAGTGSEQH